MRTDVPLDVAEVFEPRVPKAAETFMEDDEMDEDGAGIPAHAVRASIAELQRRHQTDQATRRSGAYRARLRALPLYRSECWGRSFPVLRMLRAQAGPRVSDRPENHSQDPNGQALHVRRACATCSDRRAHRRGSRTGPSRVGTRP